MYYKLIHAIMDLSFYNLLIFITFQKLIIKNNLAII